MVILGAEEDVWAYCGENGGRKSQGGERKKEGWGKVRERIKRGVFEGEKRLVVDVGQGLEGEKRG